MSPTDRKLTHVALSFVTILASAVAAAVVLMPAVARAEVRNGRIYCYRDRPCVETVLLDPGSVQLHWRGNDTYDFYNVRWSKPGTEATQTHRMLTGGRNGSLALIEVSPDTPYTFKIQGCNTQIWGGPQCSEWEIQEVITLSAPPAEAGADATTEGGQPTSSQTGEAQPVEAVPANVAPPTGVAPAGLPPTEVAPAESQMPPSQSPPPQSMPPQP